ncbi:MAG: hypothetical protein M1818_000012 [Claussenomyces sp. TS43310]|nr:MAG: hypothetical protein M1818_000012 [Claussenomyces sp. TS43310]
MQPAKILSLIHSLAAYERASSSVAATPGLLAASLSFAPSPANPSGDPVSPSRPARTLLIFSPKNDDDDGDDNGTPQGMALYFYNYSTWTARPGIYLEDLFVREAARGRGYGARLLAELAREVLDMGGARLDWSVLRWNEPSIRFYERIGATRMDEWMGCRVDGEALLRLSRRARGDN